MCAHYLKFNKLKGLYLTLGRSQVRVDRERCTDAEKGLLAVDGYLNEVFFPLPSMRLLDSTITKVSKYASLSDFGRQAGTFPVHRLGGLVVKRDVISNLSVQRFDGIETATSQYS